MTECSESYKDFCVVMVELMGDEIKEWSKSTNKLLAQTATEVLEIGTANRIGIKK